jgi:hypothetical protein
VITIDFNNPAHLAVVLICVAALGGFSFINGMMVADDEDNICTAIFILSAVSIALGLIYCFGHLTYNAL